MRKLISLLLPYIAILVGQLPQNAYAQGPQQFTLGYIAPLGLPDQIVVDSVRAFDIALDEINNDSRYNGSFRFVNQTASSADGDEMQAAKAVFNIYQNASSDLIGYVGPYLSRETQGPSVLASALSKPIVATMPVSAALTNKRYMPYLLRMMASNLDEAKFLAAFVRSAGFKNVALIVDDGAVGAYTTETFISSTLPYGVATRLILQVGINTNWDFMFRQLVQSKVTVIVYLGIAQWTTMMSTYAQKYGLKGSPYAWIFAEVTSNSVADDMELVNWEGLMRGKRSESTSGTGSTVTSQLNTKWQALYNSTPLEGALYTYDAVYVYAEAVKQVLSNLQNPLNGTALLSALKSTQMNGASGPITFDNVTNDRQVLFNMTNMRNGQPHLVQFSQGQIGLNDSTIVWPGGHTGIPKDGSEPNPLASYVVLNDTKCYMDTENTIAVTLRNTFLELTNGTGEDLTITATFRDRAVSNFVQSVNTTSDGNITVRYKFSDAGSHSVNVMYRGIHVSGSPFTLQVIRSPNADYVGAGMTSATTVTAISSLAVVLYALIFVTAALLYRYRNYRPVKALSIGFCLFILSGVLLSTSTIWLMSGLPTAASCALQIWILPLGFSLVWGSLIAKSSRIYRIFNNVRQLHASFDRSTMYLAATIICVEMLFIIVWTVWDYPKPVVLSLVDGSGTYWSCSSTANASMSISLYIYNGLLIITSVILSTRIRKIAFQLYNETLALSATVYIVTIGCLVILPVSYLPSVDIQTRYVLQSSLILVSGYAIVTILFWNRILIVLRSSDNGNDTEKDTKLGLQSVAFSKTTTTGGKLSGTVTATSNKSVKGKNIIDTKVSFYNMIAQEQKFMSQWDEVEVCIISNANVCYVKSKYGKLLLKMNMKEIAVKRLESSTPDSGYTQAEITLKDEGKKYIFQSMTSDVDVASVFTTN
ncbi:periplasmic binding protein-like I [Paraphysoderma sedebokerense]|nr:periplasmic binding protein-like I [Paraphysoderma sedebokerense]